MGKCLSTENLYGGFVYHVATVINNPVLTVRGIRIKGNVRNHPQLGKAGFQRSYRILDQPVRIVGFPTIETFGFLPDDRKERDGGNTQSHQFLRFLKKKVNTQSTDFRHRGYRLLVARSLFDEHREDQIVCA